MTGHSAVTPKKNCTKDTKESKNVCYCFFLLSVLSYFQVLFENFAERTQNYMEFNHKTALNDAVLGMMVLSYLPQIDKQLAKVSYF